jgi:para-aminobenzoate synthetase component 1
MGSMTRCSQNFGYENHRIRRGHTAEQWVILLPDGDFDFNVVIRSILYNQENKYISFSVGSAITSFCS